MTTVYNVIKLVQHATEVTPQIARLVPSDILEMVLKAARNVMHHVQHAKGVKVLIAYH